MGNEPREISDKSLRLQAASRANDGFFSTFILRKISIRITSGLVEKNVSPNTITFLSLLVGLVGAYFTSQSFYLAGGILLLCSLILDCVDGEIARYKSEFTQLGAWLDALSDRVKEFIYIFSLLYSVNEEISWRVGFFVVALQTVRHLSDYNFARLQKNYESESGKNLSKGWFFWIRKIIQLPIAERWLLLAALPLVFSIYETMRIIVCLGILSFVYALLTRFRRVTKWKNAEPEVAFIIQQRDSFLPLNISKSRVSWLIPSILRAIEFFALLVITYDSSAMSKFYLIVGVALWHYANLYDALQGKSIFLGYAGLRIAGRVAICFVAQILGIESIAITFLSIYLILIILLRGWHNVARGSK
jgi:phosphatidylglycerophosphate synthase